MDSKAMAIRVVARMNRSGYDITKMSDQMLVSLTAAIKAEFDTVSTNVPPVAEKASLVDLVQKKDAKVVRTAEDDERYASDSRDQFCSEWRTIFGEKESPPMHVLLKWSLHLRNPALGSTMEHRNNLVVAIAREAKKKLGTGARYQTPHEAFSRILSNVLQGNVYGDLKKVLDDGRKQALR